MRDRRKLRWLLVLIPIIALALVIVWQDAMKPPPLAPVWEANLGDCRMRDMRITPDGETMLVLRTGDSCRLSAYAKNGIEIWTWESEQIDRLRSIEFHDDRIYLYGYGDLVSLTSNGMEIWSCSIDYEDPPPPVQGIGTEADFLVAIYSTLYGFSDDGSIVWTLPGQECYGWRTETSSGLWVGSAGFEAIAHHADGTVAWGPTGQVIECAEFIAYPDGSVCRMSNWEFVECGNSVLGLEWHETDGTSRFHVPRFSVFNMDVAPDGGIYYQDIIIIPSTGRKVFNACKLFPDNSRRVVHSGESCPHEVRYLADGTLAFLHQNYFTGEFDEFLCDIGIGYDLHRRFNIPTGESEHRCSVMMYHDNGAVQVYPLARPIKENTHHWLVFGDLLVMIDEDRSSRQDTWLIAYRIPEEEK